MGFFLILWLLLFLPAWILDFLGSVNLLDFVFTVSYLSHALFRILLTAIVRLRLTRRGDQSDNATFSWGA
jgi:hypothetical protein